MKVLLVGSEGKMGKEMSKYFDEHCIEYFKIDVDNRDIIKNIDYDIVLDFSTSDALPDNLNLAYKRKCPLVIATTNHKMQNIRLIKKYSKSIPIFMSANFSILFTLFKRFMTSLKKVENLEAVLSEVHHKNKKDKPSGSAKELIKILNKKGIDLKVHAYRVGDVVGEHEITFYLKDEKLEIKHTANSKQVFCNGAYLACKFIKNKKIGLYTMEDII